MHGLSEQICSTITITMTISIDITSKIDQDYSLALQLLRLLPSRCFCTLRSKDVMTFQALWRSLGFCKPVHVMTVCNCFVAVVRRTLELIGQSSSYGLRA